MPKSLVGDWLVEASDVVLWLTRPGSGSKTSYDSEGHFRDIVWIENETNPVYNTWSSNTSTKMIGLFSAFGRHWQALQLHRGWHLLTIPVWPLPFVIPLLIRCTQATYAHSLHFAHCDLMVPLILLAVVLVVLNVGIVVAAVVLVVVAVVIGVVVLLLLLLLLLMMLLMMTMTMTTMTMTMTMTMMIETNDKASMVGEVL